MSNRVRVHKDTSDTSVAVPSASWPARAESGLQRARRRPIQGDSSMVEPGNLVDLFHHRWTVPSIAELHCTGGAKLVTLVNLLGVNRGALRQALDAAIRHDWIMRNPGYGHPLRPEYLLTESGAKIGLTCRELMEELRKRGLEDVMLRKWSAPVLQAVAIGCQRFVELRTALPGVTDRALAMTLKQLLAHKLLDRQLRDEFPPAAEWKLASACSPLVKILERLSSIR